MNSVQIIVFLLPILISSQLKAFKKEHYSMTCPSSKSNKMWCGHLGFMEDPFTNECVTKCDTPCTNGICDFYFCHSFDDDPIPSSQFSECKRVYKTPICSEIGCFYSVIQSCNGNYTPNPYSSLECVQRCDEDSCGIGGKCSSSGHCVCHLGYRPDPINPRNCLKIPEDNTTKLTKTCHKGFKLSDDGGCLSACGDCKNGCCGTDGGCNCWDGYELDVATSTCLPKMSCSDRCLNGVCDSDDVCQCPDCSDFIDKAVNCRADDADGLNDDYNCGNTSSSEDMISKTKHKTTIAILLSITVILFITTIVLTFIILKMKRALPINEGKIKIVFGGFG